MKKKRNRNNSEKAISANRAGQENELENEELEALIKHANQQSNLFLFEYSPRSRQYADMTNIA